MQVHVADHPLISHKLTVLRDERTDSPTFRRLADELVTLLAYEATRDVRVQPVEVKTPVAMAQGGDLYKAQAPIFGGTDAASITALSRDLSDALACPWVVLSTGVAEDAFPDAVRAACRGGAGRRRWRPRMRPRGCGLRRGQSASRPPRATPAWSRTASDTPAGWP